MCSEQHAGSAGTLLDFGQPAHPRGLQPEAEGAAQEEQEEEEEEVGEELGDRQEEKGKLLFYFRFIISLLCEKLYLVKKR